jgi:transposase IS4-like protein/DDE family transposase
MGFHEWLVDVGRRSRRESFENLRTQVGIEWVQEALKRTGTETIRRRKLPNEAVVWLVVGIALFRDRSIDSVVKDLGLAVAEAKGRRSPTGSPLSSAAVANARVRIGMEPLLELYTLLSEQWVAECDAQNQWRGLRLFALDGSSLRIADTPANQEVYGRPGSKRSEAGYPQARVVGLLTLGSRLLADFVVGSWDQGEQTLAQMLVGNLPAESLVVLDRNFVNYALYARIMALGSGRHFLCRGKKGLSGRVVRRLGPNDVLIEFQISPAQRKADPSLPASIVLRQIDYRIPGFRPSQLLTSLLDPQAYPAREIIELYHKRWEIEIAYDEIKTHTLEREEAIRSHNPDLVLQEIYGLLIAYNLVRVMMARAAIAAGVDPCRMSFRNSLLEIRDFFLLAGSAAPGTLPKHYRSLCEHLILLVLPERRHRRHPRAVKIKMSGYLRKKPN